MELFNRDKVYKMMRNGEEISYDLDQIVSFDITRDLAPSGNVEEHENCGASTSDSVFVKSPSPYSNISEPTIEQNQGSEIVISEQVTESEQ